MGTTVGPIPHLGDWLGQTQKLRKLRSPSVGLWENGMTYTPTDNYACPRCSVLALSSVWNSMHQTLLVLTLHPSVALNKHTLAVLHVRLDKSVRNNNAVAEFKMRNTFSTSARSKMKFLEKFHPE